MPGGVECQERLYAGQPAVRIDSTTRMTRFGDLVSNRNNALFDTRILVKAVAGAA